MATRAKNNTLGELRKMLCNRPPLSYLDVEDAIDDVLTRNHEAKMRRSKDVSREKSRWFHAT